ncbi:MAG TPA: hypothetical protein VFE37_02655 [Chloroflexota bacterium]|nr:hypothetical protein [Chloroflexota bacterium]
MVASVDGDVVVLMTPWGEQRVRLGPDTRVEKQVPAGRGEIAPGQLVVVNGAPAGDEIAAGTVQILGSPPVSFPGPGAQRGGE